MVSAPTWAKPSSCMPGSMRPLGGSITLPLAPSAPLACHTVLISYVIALLLPVML